CRAGGGPRLRAGTKFSLLYHPAPALGKGGGRKSHTNIVPLPANFTHTVRRGGEDFSEKNLYFVRGCVTIWGKQSAGTAGPTKGECLWRTIFRSRPAP